jgi:DNA-binding NtrC family response regulator
VTDLAMVLSDSEVLEAKDIQFHTGGTADEFTFEEITLREYNRRILHHFLDKYDHNISKVSQILEIGKSTIYRMLKENNHHVHQEQ